MQRIKITFCRVHHAQRQGAAEAFIYTLPIHIPILSTFRVSLAWKLRTDMYVYRTSGWAHKRWIYRIKFCVSAENDVHGSSGLPTQRWNKLYNAIGCQSREYEYDIQRSRTTNTYERARYQVVRKYPDHGGLGGMHQDQRGPVCLRGCYIRSDRWANAGKSM